MAAELNIGNITVQNGVLLAPMEDVTDLPFRVICKRMGADIVYTEFISSDGLIRDARRSMEKLRLSDEEHPVAIQIFGGDIEVMREAARRAEESRPDFLDINCGCWVKNVVARNAGAALLKDPPAMAAMTRELVKTVNLPVTVKTRLGWDTRNIVIVEAAKMLQDAGATALTIHCRTRDMGHSGIADWSWISRIKNAVSIPVILNGDVETPEDAARAFAETGCDGVMIGRATIGNPFIFRRAKTLLNTGILAPEPTANERINVCLEHLREQLRWKTERRAVLEFRKFYAGYLRGLPYASAVKQDVQQYESFAQVEDRMLRYKEFLTEYTSEQICDTTVRQ
ncbi:tRNA dihydrouridine synthase DusB [Ignavibacteria bacterium]|nr:tRNA dihydrouridine synthase DusB [Bacteroidota bacterium]MCZ2133255.1 tRNA dihydrouridine synthase DusB [Bacteroidota bacterium]